MANLSLVIPILVLGFPNETEEEKPILRRLGRLRDEKTMLSIDFNIKNPISQKLESLRINLIGNPPVKKPRITNMDKKYRSKIEDTPLCQSHLRHPPICV